MQIPEIFKIPGLNFRRYQGESDLPAIVALDNLVFQADQTGEVETVEQLSHHFRHLKNCDPYKDILLGVIDGQLVDRGGRWHTHLPFVWQHPSRVASKGIRDSAAPL